MPSPGPSHTAQARARDSTGSTSGHTTGLLRPEDQRFTSPAWHACCGALLIPVPENRERPHVPAFFLRTSTIARSQISFRLRGQGALGMMPSAHRCRATRAATHLRHGRRGCLWCAPRRGLGRGRRRGRHAVHHLRVEPRYALAFPVPSPPHREFISRLRTSRKTPTPMPHEAWAASNFHLPNPGSHPQNLPAYAFV